MQAEDTDHCQLADVMKNSSINRKEAPFFERNAAETTLVSTTALITPSTYGYS
jgi:hypothetical protein